jgi:hypothetical protein
VKLEALVNSTNPSQCGPRIRADSLYLLRAHQLRASEDEYGNALKKNQTTSLP